MGNCLECKNHKLDKIWGEVKCLKKQHYIYGVEIYEPCKYYEKESNKNVKTNAN